MTFYGNKTRLKILQIAGYLLCFLLFASACYLNTGIDRIRANVFLIFAILTFFATFIISKRFTCGLLTVSDEGISFLIGFRTINLEWSNIESISLFSFKGRECLGIKIKSLEFAKGALLRILDLNVSQTTYHVSFEKSAFNEDLKTIIKLMNEKSNQTLTVEGAI